MRYSINLLIWQILAVISICVKATLVKGFIRPNHDTVTMSRRPPLPPGDGRRKEVKAARAELNKKFPTWQTHHDLVWTLEEQDLLRENYGRIPTKELCKILKRTKRAIRCKASKLGVTTGATPANFLANVTARKKMMEETTQKMLEERENEAKKQTD